MADAVVVVVVADDVVVVVEDWTTNAIERLPLNDCGEFR